MNTACERITYAMERITKRGWAKSVLREAENPGGPACLLGSLVSDEEYASLLAQTPPDLGHKESHAPILDAIYRGGLPGLREACTALDFTYPGATWMWSDLQPDVTTVLERLKTGKTRACA